MDCQITTLLGRLVMCECVLLATFIFIGNECEEGEISGSYGLSSGMMCCVVW
jgi:hypothetical protein